MRTLTIPSCLLLLAGAACATGATSTNSPNTGTASTSSRAPATPGAQRTPHAGMTRYPAVSADRIAFSYADDLWTVPRAGGMASPLASPAGLETYPRFSADGQTIAFVGNYDGDVDLYTIPASGGVPFRVTHHPQNETLCGWTPDGKLLFQGNGFSGTRGQTKLMTVAPEGGLHATLPVPYGTYGAISADGKWLAYSPNSRIGRTWKRYAGGLASDLWLYELATGNARQLTDFQGSDVMPMWHGETIYFLSDAGPKHRMNLWAVNSGNGERRQVTDFDDDVRWPSIGAGAIAFVAGSQMYLMELSNEAVNVISIQIPGAQPQLRPQLVDASEFLSGGGWHVSPEAKRVAVEARGDVWTLPVKNGTPRNLTHTSGVAEREPIWSPDGRWIAFMSDASGEYELHVIQSDGKGETRQVTTDAAPFRYALNWSPDSNKLSLIGKGGYLKIVDIESGAVTDVDAGPLAQYPATLNSSWSHDSNWLAYTRVGDGSTMSSSVYLFDVQNGTRHQVTSDYFSQSDVAFDREGDFLYYAGTGNFSASYSELDSTWIYEDSSVIHVVPLRDDVDSPFLEEIDEATWDDEEDGEDSDGDVDEDGADDENDAADEGEEDGEDEDDEEEPLVIDLDGFERRAIRLPIDPGAFGGLTVIDGGALVYRRSADGGAKIQMFDVSADEPEEELVASGVGGFVVAAKGKSMLYFKGGKPFVGTASAGMEGEAVSLSGMDVTIDPRTEWAQILRDAWRLYRDFFYVESMHGVDWDAVHAKYAAMLDDAVTRRDVGRLIAEMISELNVGHAYTGGGDIEGGARRNTGLLGCDFALEEGAYRITKIYEGGVWDSDARGPLSEPGIDVSEGDFLLELNGEALDATRDPWASFGGLGGKLVTLTVSAKSTLGDDAREVTVRLLQNEGSLRYRAWIENNRRKVDEASNGQVGYVYVPDTGINGQNDLVRQFYSQTGKAAMIIDDRWNGGGQIPTRFIELLNRPVVNYWARRDGRDWKFPYDAHHGPKCMLINGSAGSGGDAFPAYFRQAGLGKLVGRRTWGGLVGISGNPGLVDGAMITVPTFGYYESDGTWGIEGYGVAPDIDVVDDPSKMLDGGDPQLEAAIELMLAEIESNGHHDPERPAAPDRSGLGVTDEDR